MMVAIRTPSGKVVEIDDTYLDVVVKVISDARDRAFDEVVELLNADIEKMKACGDFTTAEQIEVIRAKVEARKAHPIAKASA